LLKALEQADIEILYDCQKGECGLCQVNILEYIGAIDHQDFFLVKNNKMYACVSRVTNGNWVIDNSFR
jgi:vanillate O-demethylase ferredoxin subunit